MLVGVFSQNPFLQQINRFVRSSKSSSRQIFQGFCKYSQAAQRCYREMFMCWLLPGITLRRVTQSGRHQCHSSLTKALFYAIRYETRRLAEYYFWRWGVLFVSIHYGAPVYTRIIQPNQCLSTSARPGSGVVYNTSMEFERKLHEAAEYLAAQDAALAPVIAASKPCTIRPHQDYYQELVESIVGQQLSVKAA